MYACPALTDLLVDGTLEVSEQGVARLTLDPHGCRWLCASPKEVAAEDASVKSR